MVVFVDISVDGYFISELTTIVTTLLSLNLVSIKIIVLNMLLSYILLFDFIIRFFTQCPQRSSFKVFENNFNHTFDLLSLSITKFKINLKIDIEYSAEYDNRTRTYRNMQ